MHKFFALILFIFFAKTGLANENCPALQANTHADSGTYVLKQHVFDNIQDLAIIDPLAAVKRVTFGRGDAEDKCFFQPLAFEQGGENNQYWGWHILWSEASGGLFYARMDGEAWVSSIPKQFTNSVVINPQFKKINQTITINWQQLQHGLTTNLQAVSSDEGRSWQTLAQ